MNTSIHVMWTDRDGHQVALCGEADTTVHMMFEPHHIAAGRVPADRCLRCHQLLGELVLYRNARLEGMPELRHPSAWMEVPDRATSKPVLVDLVLIKVEPGKATGDGAEVRRQLHCIRGDRWIQSYMHWLEKYRPDVWHNGAVWDAGYDSPAMWNAVYQHYVDMGVPQGTLLDRWKVPTVPVLKKV